MQSDVVAEPHTVVVELVAAPVTPLTMLRVLKHMRIANVAVEVVVVGVEFVLGHVVGLRDPDESLQGDGGVCRVTGSDDSSGDHHGEEPKQVENC